MILETIVSTLITIALKSALEQPPKIKHPPAPPKPISARVIAMEGK